MIILTWVFLANAIALAVQIHRDYLREGTDELDEATWRACVHPGEVRDDN